MKQTISDIAKLAGVSKSTVSRHLNGGYVSVEAKERIEQVIKETGYEPNTFAQNLKLKTSNFIGVIIPRLDSYATARILIGVDEKLKQNNYQMLIANTSQNKDREVESLYSFANQKVAGIILLATEITEKHQTAIDNIKIPIIIMGQEHCKYNCIVYDDFNAAYELAQYVIDMGHKKIAYLGVPEYDVSVGVKRKAGFKKAVNEGRNMDISYHVTSFAIEDAVNMSNSIIKDEKPSLIFCATDNIALGTIGSIYSNHLQVPADISVVGFGGYKVSEIIYPGLTTVRFDYNNTGTIAGENIIKLIKGEFINKLIISNYQIIKKKSVDKLE
ncbi:LacI family DNA-binding transcriptional regulator [Pelosinus baikalensis]|uniref:LacI family DNA-binding transcriptional regulator n=1 Tax=Pelosinus baikalensis TaxID=2892015 RepID=A0ABS8HNI7_9FIRM|nr:LacI family DNA-binding transcriptional regulator [Pelosinus baikalensis]MCC5464620.1 LacI family DNA-binding transcriptional regulator [Pelosinus baikalensis]